MPIKITMIDQYGRESTMRVQPLQPVMLYFWLGADADSWKHIDAITPAPFEGNITFGPVRAWDFASTMLSLPASPRCP